MGRDGISASLKRWNTHEQLLWGRYLLFITHEKKNKVATGTTKTTKNGKRNGVVKFQRIEISTFQHTCLFYV